MTPRQTMLFVLTASVACVLLAAPARASSRLGAVMSKSVAGQFDVTVDGSVFFPAGAPTTVRSNNKLFSADPSKTAGATQLKQVGEVVKSEGSDAVGSYESQTVTWSADGVHFVTAVRVYESAIVFRQHFPDGLTDASSGDRDALIGEFPSIKVANLSAGHRRGYLAFQGDMVGSAFHSGEWDDSTGKLTSGIAGTAPICVFTEDLKTAVVLSPFSNFMAASQYFVKGPQTLGYGVMGNVSTVPADYMLETIFHFEFNGGVNSAMMAWGDALLRTYGKDRNAAWGRDFALQYLGYSTDNGAYFYYNTEPGKNYEQTMLDVAGYAAKEQIPYRYWLADSWWYFKGPKNGVKNWTAMPSVFPDGIGHIYEKTGWLVQGHNRYWSAATDYAKQNGGQYDFMIDSSSGYALPNDQSFWDFLMQSSRKWGLTTYEQDWLDDQTDRFDRLTQSATLGREWLLQMGTAAARNDIAIQYCMSHSRHILASVEIPAVTQARASGDYHPGADQWSPLGTTALFSYSVGVAPSKDNYWSTTYQPGNKWSNQTVEPHNRLQAAVITLTKGPVCPSDNVGHSDVELIMRSAAADGTLLQPSRPATRLDSVFVAKSLQTQNGPRGEIWFADSLISGRRFGVLFAAELEAPYDVSTMELGYGTDAQLVAVEANSTDKIVTFDSHEPLKAAQCGIYDFQIYNIARREKNGWALLGEVANKWVGVSPARFASIESSTSSLSATIRGSPGERVLVAFASPTGAQPVTVSCEIGAGSAARVSVPAGTCSGF